MDTGDLLRKHNSSKVCWGWSPGEEEGKGGARVGRGCERGLCLETDWYKNADKPAPRILLA